VRVGVGRVLLQDLLISPFRVCQGALAVQSNGFFKKDSGR
jgi:hypothetical protein